MIKRIIIVVLFLPAVIISVLQLIYHIIKWFCTGKFNLEDNNEPMLIRLFEW